MPFLPPNQQCQSTEGKKHRREKALKGKALKGKYDNVLIVNNNKKYLDSVYGAVMTAKAISRFHLVRLMHARWPPTVRPSQLTSAESPLVGCCHPHHHCHLLLLLSPNDGAHLTISRRVEGKVNLGTA